MCVRTSSRELFMILVVDDEPRNRFVVADMLKRQGDEVIQASDAFEALQVFSRLRPDVVITDLKMPELDGADLALQIHANWPGTGVILTSGYFTGKAQKVISAPWADFIYKPVDKEFLRAKIQRLRLRLVERQNNSAPHLEMPALALRGLSIVRG